MRARGTQAGPHRPPARQAEAEPLGLDKSGRQSERARNAGLVGFFGFLLRIVFSLPSGPHDPQGGDC